MTKLPDSNPRDNVKQKPAGGQPQGEVVGEHSLSAAVGLLNKQHPQKWNDLGPHHEGNYTYDK